MIKINFTWKSQFKEEFLNEIRNEDLVVTLDNKEEVKQKRAQGGCLGTESRRKT